MKRVAVVLSLLLLVFAVSVSTQSQAPTPLPELKALEVFIGEWAIEEEEKESPLGPGGKNIGKLKVHWVLNGFFQEWKWEMKLANGAITERIEYDWYDSITKSYPYYCFYNDGDTISGIWEPVKKNEWKWSEIYSHKGSQYKFRGSLTIADDGRSFLSKGECFIGEKTWIPISESKFTKVKPAK